MTSSLAAQLSVIAASSTNQLDLKAQRTAHSQSLIFAKEVAVTQDFNTIYQICYEGFQELCALDSRFADFRRSIFSEQSKTEDRLEMTASQNSDLDAVLEEFLALAAGRLLLNPAVKAVDWLVRRFRYVYSFCQPPPGLTILLILISEFMNTTLHPSFSLFFHIIRRLYSSTYCQFYQRT
jgi:U3 small nucleolar RNA-associated protein 10